MDTITLLGIALILYGVATLAVAIFKPKAIWKMGKIQGFVQLLTERGTVIFFSVVGLGTILGGAYILLR